ncbi:MAG: hypothetical protein ACXWNK_17255 [Vulcanimicrobiaceae bacterium]
MDLLATSEHAAPARADRVDRIVDIVTVILISLATVASAWCGYQAARWGELQTLNYSRANAARVEASIAAGRSSAIRLLDVGLFVQYEGAVFEHKDRFAEFLRHRFTPELRKAVDVWLASKPLTNPRAPLSPFAMAEYHVRSDDAFAAASKRADALTEEGHRANQQSDAYVYLTVLFASVSFLGGVGGRLRYPWHMVLTAIGTALLVIAAFTILRYPVY